MKKLFLFFLIFILSCSSIAPKINPVSLLDEKKLYVTIRVAYQQDLPNKLETRKRIAETFLQLEKELNVRFDVVLEGEFAYTNPTVDAPDNARIKQFMQNVLVSQKMQICDIVNKQMIAVDHTNSAILCIFDNTLTPKWSKKDGVVLGATAVEEGIISATNLKNKFMFINVLRHEFGHLLGAEHSTDLMTPYLPKESMKHLLPFPEVAIKEMQEHIKNHLQ